MTIKKRLEFVDCSRAMCMLWIVGAWHMFGYLNNINEAILSSTITSSITNGVLATFTFISAYFLGQKRISSMHDILEFLKKRFLRIYPLFFLSCTSFLLIYIWGQVEYINGVYQYILTLLGIAPLVGKSPQTIWYVSMLLSFYFITPFILKNKTIKIRLVVLVLISALLLTLESLEFGLDGRVALFFPFYAAGLMCSNCLKTVNDKFNFKYLIVSMFCFFLFVYINSKSINIFWKYLYQISFLVLIIEIGKLAILKNRLKKILIFISYASMSAYLFHRQFFGVIELFIGKFPVWAAYFIILPILLMISYFIQYVYDLIIYKLLKKRSSRILEEHILK